MVSLLSNFWLQIPCHSRHGAPIPLRQLQGVWSTNSLADVVGGYGGGKSAQGCSVYHELPDFPLDQRPATNCDGD